MPTFIFEQKIRQYMNVIGLRAPENQAAKFIELFFDIIFVFSVVQIVELLHGHFDVETVFKALLIFFLVWWSWTQFTWSLNLADTENVIVELAILFATAVSLIMAISIPTAFEEGSLGFGIAYVITRGIGSALYVVVSQSYGDAVRNAVVRYTILSLVGAALILGGSFLGGTLQILLWTGALAFEVILTFVAASDEGWYLQPDHFVERHGLFMIIVLGETLLINANGLLDAIEDTGVLSITILAVLVTLAFWWSYFARLKHKLEETMVELGPEQDVQAARDIYSLGHIPIIFGIIAYASALEEVIKHPTDPIEFQTRMAFAVGFLLFALGTVIAIRRATGGIVYSRMYIPVIVGILILVLPSISPLVILGLIFAGLLFISINEERLIFLHKTSPHHDKDHEHTAYTTGKSKKD